MKIVIKTKNLKLNQAIRDFIEEKINSLEKFAKILQAEEKYFNHFFAKGKPRVEAWVEIGKTTLHHKKGPVFRAECQMRFPKRSLRATAEAKDLKMAITEVKDELQRELKQYREQLTSLTKRRARVLKKELRLSPQARFWRGRRTSILLPPSLRSGKGRIREEGI